MIASAVAQRPVSALVNNAGLLLKRYFGAWSAEDLHALYQVNVVVPVLFEYLREVGGSGMPEKWIAHVSHGRRTFSMTPEQRIDNRAVFEVPQILSGILAGASEGLSQHADARPAYEA